MKKPEEIFYIPEVDDKQPLLNKYVLGTIALGFIIWVIISIT